MIVAASAVGVLGALSVIVMVIVVGVTGWRCLVVSRTVRMLRDGRGDAVTVRRVRVHHRMSSRGFLEVADPGEITWWPIYFDPSVLSLIPGECARRGQWAGAASFSTERGVVAVPAGRARHTAPRGTIVDAPRLNDDDLRLRSARFGSLRRRVLLDFPRAVGAPIVAVLWVSVGGGGFDAFVAATVLAAAVAVWSSAIGGSDPS
ncbi:hypothetical protein [Williamsia deligens]|uniref:PH domain-containing protein n=1 Tax=Williamsia deligens TaxID=321325 RepID=A0ABW3G457_9NOCA|nr:hypothetical protein [Williamsia deligens]MCP2194452.1 hypothetical protein [Williamsia deligens]